MSNPLESDRGYLNELITPSLLWFLFGCFLLFIEMLTSIMIIFFFELGAWVAAIFAAYAEISFNAEEIRAEGGQDEVSLRIAEQGLEQFGRLAQTNNTMMIPSDMTNIASVLALSKKVLDKG